MTTRIKRRRRGLLDALSFPEEYTAVVVSTAHMPVDERNALQAGLPRAYIYQEYDYGFRVYCCIDEASEWPPTIRPLMKRAKELGHRWVDFDCDGDIIEGFKTYEETPHDNVG